MERIDFADIQTGDRIVAKWTVNGVEHTETATVSDVVEHFVIVGTGKTYWGSQGDVEYFIERQPLPTERPAFILATRVFDDTGEWLMVLDHDGDWQVVQYDERRLPGGSYYAEPSEITSWRPAKVVVA